MAREIQGEGCELRGSAYCELLNMKSCESCTAFGREPEEMDRLRRDLDVLTSLLPEEGVAHLFSSEECLLCKGETRGKRACYAMVDMAHPEPRRKKSSAIGIKVKSQVGSLVPVQVACCADCRKRFRILEYLPVAMPLGAAVLMLILVNIPVISDGLRAISVSLPALLFLLVTLAAYVAGRMLVRQLMKEYGKKMELNILDLPTLRRMREKGWFPISQERGGRARPVFLKQRFSHGICTGVPEEACVSQGEEKV